MPTTTPARPRSVWARLPSDVSSAGAARALIDSLLGSCALDRTLLQDVELVAYELVVNAVLHGSPTPQDAIELTCVLEAEHLVVSVRDAGSTGHVAARPFSAEAPSGRGLVMVAGLSESWSVDRTAGTLVTARLAA